VKLTKAQFKEFRERADRYAKDYSAASLAELLVELEMICESRGFFTMTVKTRGRAVCKEKP
jgi:hypothetical protein